MPDCADLIFLADMVRSLVTEVLPADARQQIAEGALPIDVRDEEELLRNPPLAGAVNLSRGRLEYLLSDAVSGRDTPVILYCSDGHRSVLAADSLRLLGYSHVTVLKGGLHAWRDHFGQRWITAESYLSTGSQQRVA